MRKLVGLGLLALGVFFAQTAAAERAGGSAAPYAKRAMTYTTVAAAKAAVTAAYSGVGSVFTRTVSTGPDHGYLCTGSLITGNTVLTAAHCIYDHNDETGASDPITSIAFYLPSFGERASPGVEIYAAVAAAYNPLFDNAADLPDGILAHTGDIVGGHDVALITLGQLAAGHDTYGLYVGDPLRQYLEVGTGSIGGPAGMGQGIDNDFAKRTGSNLFELYGSDLFDDVTEGVVLSDFDDGTVEHDVFGRNLAQYVPELAQTGVIGEADSSPGDSGGPEFIDGAIAAVTSFGITGGIFDGFCGGTSTDPYNSSGSTEPTSLRSCTNSSVGEIAGDTLTAYNLDFFADYFAGRVTLTVPPFAPVVPEPDSWAMALLGFGVLGGGLRRGAARRRLPA